MAAAVAEAHRVLTGGGVLLALHPTDDRPTLEVWHARDGSGVVDEADAETARRLPLGPLTPDLAARRDFTAATEALAAAVDDVEADAPFDPAAVRTFDYFDFFDSLDDLTDYLDDNPEFARADDALLEAAALALDRAPGPARLVIVQRMVVAALQKN